MDIDKFYRLIGAGIKRIYGYYVIRPLQRFNVDNRAEKLIEKQLEIPKTAPRHKGTDQMFKQITEKNPEFRKQLEERREDLLSRLKSVKVVSKDAEVSEEDLKEMEEIRNKVRNRLPQSREGELLPMHAFIEPKYVPKGKVSLFGALQFMAKHNKSPDQYNAQLIAKEYNMKAEDVQNILMYFKPFYKDEGVNDPFQTHDKEMVGLLSLDRIKSFLKPKKTVSNQQIEGTNDDSLNSSKHSKHVNEKKDQ